MYAIYIYCNENSIGPKQKFRPNLFHKRDDLVWIILEDLLLISQLGFLELNHQKKTLNFFFFIYFFFFVILRTLTHVLLYKNTHISHQLSYHGGLFIFHLCWFFFFWSLIKVKVLHKMNNVQLIQFEPKFYVQDETRGLSLGNISIPPCTRLVSLLELSAWPEPMASPHITIDIAQILFYFLCYNGDLNSETLKNTLASNQLNHILKDCLNFTCL